MYEKLIEKANEYVIKAQSTNNLDLRIFYLNASKGYKQRAESLTVGDVTE